ncbi:molybdopterin molybdotransferase MoeA [Devosia nitrariae]|uniref:Molybdopterin molybdenumtransferase n=1 Tax=Devosia nitrariae TaxID=2071872 RepID=A0ABQ5WD83_9HYPH|nr:gephyrin-like molybdotransferase Glp [Devosia nitrariae]GLQ57802.1 molybdopterin molybdenumtransferase MoeA [Devosia nitrariae]
MSLLPVDEALTRILARVPQARGETLALAEANGRVLAAPLIAGHNQPPFDASAMDGYAVRAADIVEGHALEVIGVSQAGAGYEGAVGRGQCVRIFTGAPVPSGADAVIMQEEAQVDGRLVRFSERPRPGRSIRPLGNDFAAGQTLLPAGTLMTPFALAMAAAANNPALIVAERPRIAVLATGDELVLPGTPLAPGQIVASNSYGLVPLLSPYAREISDYGIVGDDRAALATRLEAIFSSQADMLVTTGGASVGDRDIVQEVLTSLGVTVDFWRINMRPGKPLMFGTRGKTLVFGLPGNPVSAMVTASVFIKPALRRWLGLADPRGPALRLPLAAPTPPNGARRHFMRANLTMFEDRSLVMPISETDSGHTSSLAKADVLIVQSENDPGQPAGAIVDVVLLAGF